jgi:hypothetical protein
MWLLAACTPDIVALYAQERATALAIAESAPQAWHADLSASIAASTFQDVVGATVAAALQAPAAPIRQELALGVAAELRPHLKLRKLAIGPSTACQGCLAFDADVGGKASSRVGPIEKDWPVDLGIAGVIAVEVKGGRKVEGRLFRVDKVELRMRELGGLSTRPNEGLGAWIQDALRDRMPVVPVADLGDKALPTRGLRVRTPPGAVVVEALTDVPGARPAAPVALPESGVRLLLSETALGGLARRAAFEKGPVAMDVAIDPRALDVEGDRFTLQLRLWRLAGRGWWRDYRVDGAIRVDDGKIRLKPSSVVETAQSPGAGLADPLALLFEGKILDAVADGIAQSVPGQKGADVGGARVRADITRVVGQDDTLVVDATLRVVPSP